MGQSCSVLNRRQVENNSLLQELFGKETIPLGEPFWNQFLSFNCDAIVTRSIHKSLWSVLEKKLGTQIIENYRSGNVVNLIANFIQYSKEIIAIYQSGDAEQGNGDILIKHARNALLVIRFVIQCMTIMKNGGNGGLLLLEIECLPQQSKDDESESICVFDEFITYLFKLLFSVPVNDVSLELHLEILLTCFILLSYHLYSGIDVTVEDDNYPVKKRAFLTAIGQNCNEMTRYLLTNVINRYETPKQIMHNTMSVVEDKPTSLMVASFDWLRGIFSSADNKVEESDDDISAGVDLSVSQTTKSDLQYALANHSLLYLVMLSCSDFSYFSSTTSEVCGNPFLNALVSFIDSEMKIASSPSSKTVPDVVPAFSLSVSSICIALSSSLSDSVGLRRRPSLVLLYLLLHRNASFKACALSRTDIDRLVVPLLRILYSYTTFGNENSSHMTDNASSIVQHGATPMGKGINTPVSSWHRDHSYLSLICLLIFTEDDAFCRFANDLTLASKSSFSFYVEHGDSSALGTHPTLASLALLVLLRAIRRNLLIGRDHYLHTSCLAALANLCAHSNEMHAAVASRLVDLVVALARRRVRLCAMLREGGGSTTSSVEETEAALSATDDTARLLLEAANAALSGRGRGPTANPHLVVSLLREQESIMTAFRSVPNFQDLLQNLSFILEYFTAQMERESTPSPSTSTSHSSSHPVMLTSVSDVLKVVKSAGSHFPVTRLRKMPDLKFHYVEESSASSHFFLPYAMALYQRYGFIYWPSLAPDTTHSPNEQQKK